MSRLNGLFLRPLRTLRGLLRRGVQRLRFRQELRTFTALHAAATPRLPLHQRDLRPCLDERTSITSFDRHYVYHTAWAARVLAHTRPSEHIDIGSYLYFGAIVSAFVPMRFYDYRPPDLHLAGLRVEFADLLALPFADSSVASLSCMHTVEHVGLGRYGDRLDPDGDLKAMAELKRVLAPGGSLLFVVPVGTPRIQFNAHRIYAYEQICAAFAGLELVEFALIPDDPRASGLLVGADSAQVNAQRYGCGCFWFRRGGEEQRNRGAEEQRNRGAEEQRNRGTEEQRNRGTEEQSTAVLFFCSSVLLFLIIRAHGTERGSRRANRL